MSGAVPAPRPGALSGIRVVEFAQYMQGPWCAQLLGDMGADVIKVEPPGRGDGGRHPGAVPTDGDNFFFLALNRNKRSVALDLKQPGDLESTRALIDSADVVVENFRPGTMERLGLGYDALAARNPGLVYASASGWGADGPLARRLGQDLLVQAFSGAMSSGGRAGEPPAPSGMFVADGLGSMLLAFGVVTALYARAGTGRGQRVETSLLDALVHMQTQELVTYMNSGVAPRRGPNGGHVYLEGPYGTYETADGWVVLANIPLDALAEALELPPLRKLFAAGAAQAWSERERLVALIAPVIATRPTAHWVELFQARDLTCAPVQGYDELLAHEQLAANELLTVVAHPRHEQLRLTGIPLRLSETPGTIHRPPPLLGEHTAELLRELGRDEGG